MSTWYLSPVVVLRKSGICTASCVPGSRRAAPNTRPSWSRTASQPIWVSAADAATTKLPAGWSPTDTASPVETAEGLPAVVLLPLALDDVPVVDDVVAVVGLPVCEPVRVTTHPPPIRMMRIPAPIINQLVLSDVSIDCTLPSKYVRDPLLRFIVGRGREVSTA